MKILHAGEITFAQSHAELINKTLGTNYLGYRKSSVDLAQFGNIGIIAWFVHMDGTAHGTADDYIWKNFLSADENTIKEFSVGSTQKKVIRKHQEEGFHPFRLAFQLAPFSKDNRYCCKFIGAFCLSKFLRDDQTAIEYKRVAKEFRLGAKGGLETNIDGKELFIKNMEKYYVPLEEMDFPSQIYSLLKRSGISYAGELLELEFGSGKELIQTIQNHLLKIFH